ncbi:MAG: hypothetical protein RXR20_09790 [Paraburkholderia sp.]
MNFFFNSPYRNANQAVIQSMNAQKAHVTGLDGVFEMEKWRVVAGIWTMCAMCAVFFIRGATSSVARETVDASTSSDDARGAVRE